VPESFIGMPTGMPRQQDLAPIAAFIAMAIAHAKIVIPAEAGISSMPGQGLQEDPGLRRDDRIVGLLGCHSNNPIGMARLRWFHQGNRSNPLSSGKNSDIPADTWRSDHPENRFPHNGKALSEKVLLRTTCCRFWR
jgi:hypothetical protein